MKKKTKEDVLIKEILKAAKMLFSLYGLKKTTMDDVAKAVGKGKSTLYYYYPSKTELFQSVVRQEMSNATRLTRIAVNREQTAEAKFSAYILSRLGLKEDYSNLSKVVLEDLFDNYKDIYRLKVEFEATHLDFIREIIRGGIQSNEFRKMEEQDIAVFCLWINAALSGLEKPDQISIGLTSVDNYKQIINYILHGIAVDRNFSSPKN